MANQARRIAAALALAALASGCGRAERRGEPLAGPLLETDTAQGRGRIVFMQNCEKCHPQGEPGVGPSLLGRRVSYKPDLAFHRPGLKAEEIKDLRAYLDVLRVHAARAERPLEARENDR